MLVKVNSVQEAYAKCFVVHILKFEILQITWKKWNKEHQTLSFQFFTNRFSILKFFVLFLHKVCKISNFDMWTAKHLAQASCTELTVMKTNLISFNFCSMFLQLFPKRDGKNLYLEIHKRKELCTYVCPFLFWCDMHTDLDVVVFNIRLAMASWPLRQAIWRALSPLESTTLTSQFFSKSISENTKNKL